jgi:S1-C subfamily serine protease
LLERKIETVKSILLYKENTTHSKMRDRDIIHNLLVQKLVPECTSRPWNSKTQCTRGTAFELPLSNRRLLLTNEHVVRNATHISIENKTTSVNIVFTSRAHDLAILETTETSDSESEKIVFAKQIRIGESITIIGYPQGSVNQAISGGYVNRLVELNYNGVEPNVIFQLATASDLGSSGSPVFNSDGDLIGVAAYKAINTGSVADIRDACFMIPFTIVQHFLETFKRSSTSALLPNLAILTSRSQSPMLRRHYLQDSSISSDKGVLITKSGLPELQHGDFLLSINTHEISAVGMSRCEELDNDVPYWYFIKCLHPGDTLNLQIMRHSKILNLSLILKERAIPKSNPTTHVQYKNLTFTEVSGVIILSEARLSDTTNGYNLEQDKILLKINDHSIDDLENLEESLQASTESIKFEFADGDVVII